MKITHIGTTGRLEFNDLGSLIKAVAPQARNICLNPGQSIYIPDGTEAMFSAQSGDIHKFAVAGKISVNDSMAIGATLVAAHNYNYIPSVTVAKASGANWVAALVGTDYTATTNAAMTQTTIVNLSGVALKVRIS